MEIIIIAALAENFVIGKNNRLPWHYKEDFQHFKTLTTGHPIVMGRKTYESIGKPLPNRKNIVLTRDLSQYEPLTLQGCYPVESLTKAIILAEHEFHAHKLFIIGGAQVYEQGLSLVDTMELTLVHKNVEGDTYFPKWDEKQWKEFHREDLGEISFVTLKRIS